MVSMENIVRKKRTCRTTINFSRLSMFYSVACHRLSSLVIACHDHLMFEGSTWIHIDQHGSTWINPQWTYEWSWDHIRNPNHGTVTTSAGDWASHWDANSPFLGNPLFWGTVHFWGTWWNNVMWNIVKPAAGFWKASIAWWRPWNGNCTYFCCWFWWSKLDTSRKITLNANKKHILTPEYPMLPSLEVTVYDEISIWWWKYCNQNSI